MSNVELKLSPKHEKIIGKFDLFDSRKFKKIGNSSKYVLVKITRSNAQNSATFLLLVSVELSQVKLNLLKKIEKFNQAEIVQVKSSTL
jgi:hypothetical protein